MSLKWTDYLEAVKKVRSRNDGTVQGRTFQMQTSNNENVYPSFWILKIITVIFLHLLYYVHILENKS